MSAGLKPIVQTFVPNSDLSSKQFTFVKALPAQTVDGCAADEKAIGVMINAPTTSDVAEVAVAQGARLKISGTVTAGDSLRADTGGLGKTVTSGVADAIAMDSGVANDVIPVKVARHWAG